MNYGNRNATSKYTNEDIAKSYTVACGSSIAVALGIRKALESRTRKMKGPKLIFFNSISAFLACSTAGSLNAYIMRRTELHKGIDVVDPRDPNVIVGKSVLAAKKAVTETAISRYILTIPLLFPSVVLYGIERAGMLPRKFWPNTLL